MHYHNKRASRTILTILAAAGISFSSFGCQGPEESITIDRLPATNGDSYEVNLIMLSELSGRILPQKIRKIDIARDSGNNYCLKASLDNNTCIREARLNEFIEEQDDNKTIYINPYKGITPTTDSRIECIANKENFFECTPYFSGMAMIEKIWNDLFEQNESSIHIGNGDNYGVSNGFSKDNHNVPTILALNQLGFDVDTFGNHTFDDSDSLSMLRDNIDKAQFSFTVSNLSNIIQNLNKVNTYKIVSIPSSKKNERPLQVAVVGAIDTSLGDTISTGYMGTLTTTSYCDTIYAMEDAYNMNARAFVILAHVFSYRPECLSLFIKTLHDALQYYGPNAPCQNSRLIISNEMLEETKKTRKEITANDLRKEIRKNIFNNILAIFNEEGDTPIFSSITDYDKFLTYNDNAKDSNSNLFIKNNIHTKNYYNDAEFKRTFLNDYYQFKYTHKQDSSAEDENTESPLLYIQFPAKGSHTAKVSFTIKADQTIVNDKTDTIAKTYQSQLKSIELEPVLSSGNAQFTDDTHNNKILTDKYDYTTCNTDLYKFESTYQLKECNLYFNDYVNYLKTGKDKPDINNCFNEVGCVISYDKKNCKIRQPSTAMRTKDLEELFSCLYNVTLWEYDSKTKTLDRTSICKFKNYMIAGENRNYETRAFSTFIGNFITDIVLNELKKRETDKYDLTIMNSGTARDTSDFVEIDTEFFKDYFPFENNLYSIDLNVQQLHDYIEYGLNPETDGGFPIFSGIKVYYHEKQDEEFKKDQTDPNNSKPETTIKKKIVEIWTTDQNNEVVNPIYLERCDGNSSYEQCIKNETCCLKENKSNLCNNDTCKKKMSSPDTKSTYKVVITQYMTTAGDGYPTYKNTEIKMNNKPLTITGLIKDALTDGRNSDDHSCGLKINEDTTLSTEELLKLLLKKHLFSDEDIIKNDDYHKDKVNNNCVATQGDLYKELAQQDETFKRYCNYPEPNS